MPAIAAPLILPPPTTAPAPVAAGGGGGDDDAIRRRDERVMKNQGLVRRVAIRHAKGRPDIKRPDIEDLVQWGNLGLIRAAETFGPSHGMRFSHYAGYCIRAAILGGLELDRRPVRLPYHARVLVRRYRRAERDLAAASSGDAPADDRVFAELGLSPLRERNARRIVAAFRREFLGGDEAGLDALVAPEDEAPTEVAEQRAVAASLVARMLATLDDRTREVLTLRYGLAGRPPLNHRESCHVAGLVAGRSRQIEEDALARLRERFRAAYEDDLDREA